MYTPTYEAAPKRPDRRRPWLVIGAVTLALLLLIAAGFLIASSLRPDELSKETAQRECRTAMEREANRRIEDAKQGGAEAVGSVTGIDLQETWKIDNGWAVNGTVNFMITAAFVGSLNQAVGLTCQATGSDDKVATSVKNRS
ncbi:MAG TPA: hypothetical protein VFY84_17550 [Jiangellales bacterium]|nr:hypothetical protein [Jiangellales bacterium]